VVTQKLDEFPVIGAQGRHDAIDTHAQFPPGGLRLNRKPAQHLDRHQFWTAAGLADERRQSRRNDLFDKGAQ
jgi:hypothetical protein